MKKFEIEMDIHFTKTLHIEAPNEDAATVLAETMLLCTDALPLTDADMIGLITTATELEKKPASKPAPVEEDEDDEDDECFCCGDCTICGICDEEEDDEDEDLDPAGVNGKPMGLDELMLHLSMYMEDAEEQLDDARAALSSIEKFARAILKATSAKKPAAEAPTPAVQ